MSDDLEKRAEQLKELRDMHKLNIIDDAEFERRTYFVLHPEAVPKEQKKKQQEIPANELLAAELKELRDMHKLNIIDDAEFEKRSYNILHKKQ